MSEDRDLLAAEVALGLIDGGELEEARRRASRDPDFAAAVAAWEERLHPLADALPPVAPGPELWGAIERRIAEAPTAANDNAAVLARRLKWWRTFGAGMTGLAASLAAVLAVTMLRGPGEAPSPVAERQRPGAAPRLLMASLAAGGVPNSASVTYDDSRGTLFLTPGHWPADPTHDHVVWIIPPEGGPVPIGTCCQRGPESHVIPAELRPHFRARSAIAVSVEPLGGPVGNRPASPFVVRGELRPI